MSYDIERYLNVRKAYGASFGPDGERIAFLLDTTGVPQVWTLDAPGAWPDQRTFADERVTFASWSPERDELAFGMDEGGNERTQLFRLDAADGTITPLTATPDAKHRWGGWSHDGERFAFASNRRDESVFDVYVQDRDARGDVDGQGPSARETSAPADAELVHEGDGWLSVAGWSPDDDRLIVHEAHSSFDHDLHVLHLDSGELEHLTPDTDDVRYGSPEWGPDGDAIYLVSDEGADTTHLARLDLDGRDLSVVEAGGEWNVGGVAVDDETGRLAYSRNVDGYTDLTVGELAGPTEIREFPEPDLPGGVCGGVGFGPDAERFAITVNGDSVNPNVFVVDVESGDAERWTDAPTAGIPRDRFRESELVRVESFDGLDVPGYLTLPEGAGTNAADDGTGGDGDTPVVVDIHGGPASQRRPSFHGVKQYLVDRGYAVFEPNVRGSSGYGREYAALDDVEKRMDSVADVKACVDWLADHPAVDSDRIAAMGGSYGGFMVLACLTEYPDLWAAGVDIVGIANFVTFLENTGDWRRSLREAEYGSLDDDRELLESISPIHDVDDIAAPLFVLHGENDPRVPVGEAEQVVERAREGGVPVRKLIFEDEGHGFAKLENRIEAYSAIAEFLDEHV